MVDKSNYLETFKINAGSFKRLGNKHFDEYTIMFLKNIISLLLRYRKYIQSFIIQSVNFIISSEFSYSTSPNFKTKKIKLLKMT